MKFEPLYLQVKEILRSDFTEARRVNGLSRLPSLNDLQQQYHVSRPTISKALAALAAEGILVKEAGRGSFALVDPAVKTPLSAVTASNERLTIGYIAPISDAELPQRAFRGIDRIAHRRNCRVLMAGSRYAMNNELTAVREMIDAGAAGIVIYPSVRSDEERPRDYLPHENFGVPIVLIDTCTAEQGHVQVTFDNRRAGHQMTRWLVEHGHRRVAIQFYAEALQHPVLSARIRGYREALEVCRIASDDALIALDDNMEKAIDGLLALPERPTAIIATEDTTAIEIVEVLAQRGVHVPGDITVVGFDNMMVARRYQPAIPTTNPDFEVMGEIACEMLLDGIAAGNTNLQHYVLPVPILIRPNLNRHAPRPQAVTHEHAAIVIPGNA